MSTPKDLVGYLKEHVTYERRMLEFAFYQLHKMPEGPWWNVMFESCCLHLRNLYEFLRNDQKVGNGFHANEFCVGNYRQAFHRGLDDF